MRRPQTPRYACQFGRLASTSSVGAWTPCAASSAAVDALGSDPSSAEHARPSYRTAASNRGEFDAVRGGRTVRPQAGAGSVVQRCADVAGAPWQTRRPPPAGATTPAIAPTPSPAAVDPAELKLPLQGIAARPGFVTADDGLQPLSVEDLVDLSGAPEQARRRGRSWRGPAPF